MIFDGATNPNVAYSTTDFNGEEDESMYDNDLTHDPLQWPPHPSPPTFGNSTIPVRRPLPPTTDNSSTVQPPPTPPLPPTETDASYETMTSKLPPTFATNDSGTVQPSRAPPLPPTEGAASYEIMVPQEKKQQKPQETAPEEEIYTEIITSEQK